MRGKRGTAGQRAHALPMQKPGQKRLGRADAAVEPESAYPESGLTRTPEAERAAAPNGIPLRRPPDALAQLQQLPRHAGGQVHAAVVTVGMAELDQVVQQFLIQGRQATAAIAAVPSRVVGVLARLGLVALLQRAEAATAAALRRVGGSEPCAAVRAGSDQASSNGARLSQVQDNLASLRAIRRGVFLGLSR
jgi:hypothetical protein